MLTVRDNKENIQVKKHSGDLVDFDQTKLISALKRSGASEEQIRKVVEEVENSLFHGITTSKIYSIAYQLLKKQSNRTAGRYRLRKAIQELGPTGYPFENFVAKLLEHDGYKTTVGVVIKGKCVSHEIDVVAEKADEYLIVECKYHNDPKIRSDVKVPLYIQSRFNDIRAVWIEQKENKTKQFKGLLITNSKFSDDARQFGKCAKLNMISWEDPRGNSLKDWIDSSGLHPLTSLHSLRKEEKAVLLKKGVVLVSEIVNNPHFLDHIVTSEKRVFNILKEASAIVS